MIKKPIEKKKETVDDKPTQGEKKDSNDGPKIDPSNFKVDPKMFGGDGKIDEGAFKDMYDNYMKENNMDKADMDKAFDNLSNEMKTDDFKEKASQKQDGADFEFGDDLSSEYPDAEAHPENLADM